MYFDSRFTLPVAFSVLFSLTPMTAFSSENQQLFVIGGKSFARTDLSPVEQNRLHELELNRFKTVESMARQRYVDEKTRDYEKLKTAEKPFAAEEKWLKQSFEPSQAEINKALEKFKDEKQLQSLAAEEKNKVIRRYLEQQKRVKALTDATDLAMTTGEIKLHVTAPIAPVVNISKSQQAVLGDVKAPIRIVEFTDFQCPFCKKMAGVSPEILKKYGKDVSWEVRHFPLNFHKQAKAAAGAVYCASLQGKLMDAKKWVFDAQEKLEQENIYSEMSTALKLKKSSFDECRKSESTEKIIQADLKEGERIGVSGTPTVFVNGKKFEGDVQSLEAWDKLLTSLLKTSGKSPTL